MASLYWDWRQYTLSEANEDIGEINQGINAGLPGLGYTNVNGTGGGKGNFYVAVLYLYIGDRNFWQVIGCGGTGDWPEAQGYINEILNMINNFHSL